MAKSPAFQFYPRDFLSDPKVQLFTTEEVGAYTLLLCIAWMEGGIPDDMEAMAKWTRMDPSSFQVAWKHLQGCFTRDPHDSTRWVQKRMEEIREEQRIRREKQVRGGQNSARKRKRHNKIEVPSRQPASKDTPKHLGTSASASASASAIEKPMGGADVLWPVYVEVVAKPAGKAVTLTAARRQKLQALWDEQLGRRPDPEALFRRLCVALRSSEHHASKWEYLLPESFLRSPERRERWVNKAAGGPAGDAETVKVDRMTQLAEKWG